MVGLAAPTHPTIVAHCNQGGAVNTPPHSLAGGQLRDLTRMVQIFLFPRIHHRPGAFIIETLVICYDTRPRCPAVTSSVHCVQGDAGPADDNISSQTLTQLPPGKQRPAGAGLFISTS